MKVNVEDLSSVKKVMHIEIAEEDIKSELDANYSELKKSAKVKGFRKGKTPIPVLKRLYQKDVNKDSAAKLVQLAYSEALEETRLKIVGPPKVVIPEFKGEGSLKFDAEVEVKPDIDDIDFKGLSLTRTLHEPSEEEVDKQLKMLQKNMIERVKIKEERPVKEGDVVVIDFEGFQNGKPFTATPKTDNHIIKIGENTITSEFDTAICGMTAAQEKEITIRFKDDYHNNQLAGQEVDFKITLNEIREEILPEINDELAKKMGPYKSLEELKAEINKNLKNGYAKRIEQELSEQIFIALIERSDFELPEILVEYELEHTVKDTEQMLSYQNKTLEDQGLSKEQLFKQYRNVAEKQVRRQLILNKIIEQEKLELSDENFEKGLEDMAKSVGQSVEQIKMLFNNNKEGLDNLKYSLLEKQAVKFILENNEVQDKKPDIKSPVDSDQTDSGQTDSD